MTLKQNNLCVLKCGLSYCEDFGWFSKHEFKDTNEENTLYISGYKFWFVFIWLYWIWCLHFSRRSPTSLLVMKLMKLIVISYQSWEKSILGALLRMKTCMTTSWAGSDRTFTLFSAFRRWGRNFEIELWSFLPLFQDALLTGSADGPRMPWLLVSMGESFYIRISGLLCVCVYVFIFCAIHWIEPKVLSRVWGFLQDFTLSHLAANFFSQSVVISEWHLQSETPWVNLQWF